MPAGRNPSNCALHTWVSAPRYDTWCKIQVACGREIVLCFSIPGIPKAVSVAQSHSPATTPTGMEIVTLRKFLIKCRVPKTRKAVLPNFLEGFVLDITLGERSIISNLTTQDFTIRHNRTSGKSGPAEKRIGPYLWVQRSQAARIFTYF